MRQQVDEDALDTGLVEIVVLSVGHDIAEQARVVERHTLSRDGNTIHVALTLEDPEYYTEPVQVAREFKRMPDGEILEDLCVVSDYLYQ